MSSYPKRKIVDSVSIGGPPKIRRKRETIKCTIHDFENLKQSKQMMWSPDLRAHGLHWAISFYPPAMDHKGSPWNLALQAPYETNGALDSLPQYTRACFRCKGISTGFRGGGAKGVFCFDDPFKHEDITDYLEGDGRLAIEIDIHIDAGWGNHVWYPLEMQKHNTLVELYQDASSETSDVIFSVEDATYKAHKNILALNCEKLYELTSECNDTPIPIMSMGGNIFKKLLDYVYRVNTEPIVESSNIAKELLVAADRFECVYLKLYAESVLVDKFLSIGNVAELLIFADSHSCALLKEAATNLILKDPAAARKANDWPKLEESTKLLSELFACLPCPIEFRLLKETATNFILADAEAARKANDWPKVKESTKLLSQLFANLSRPVENRNNDRMTVTTLREELEKANLDVDGSREVLVERLKTHQEAQEASKASSTTSHI